MDLLDSVLDCIRHTPMDILLDIEVWRRIPGYPIYDISNLGRIRNSQDRTILVPRKHSKGYHIISLRNNEGPKAILVHRLVAQVWILNPEGKPCIDHKDGDRTNNGASNLRWVTYSENAMNKIKTSNCSSIFKGVCFMKDRQKYQSYIRINGKLKRLGYFQTAEEAAEKYNDAAIKYFGQFARVNDIK